MLPQRPSMLSTVSKCYFSGCFMGATAVTHRSIGSHVSCCAVSTEIHDQQNPDFWRCDIQTYNIYCYRDSLASCNIYSYIPSHRGLGHCHELICNFLACFDSQDTECHDDDDDDAAVISISPITVRVILDPVKCSDEIWKWCWLQLTIPP